MEDGNYKGVQSMELDEETYYQSIAEEYKNKEKIIHNRITECYNALLDNRIIIVSIDEVSNDDLSLTDFIDTIENLNTEEDFINSHTRSKLLEDKADGILIVYPQNRNNNIGNINVEAVKNLSEFIEKVIRSKKADGFKTFYRGHGSWKYELVPGIYREKNKSILENESDYIRNIIASYPKFFTDCKSALDFLSVLQHHAFPTRLLDFSENPLIALYMACDNNSMEHADTIRIDVPDQNFKYYDSDTVSVLANLAFSENSFSIKGAESKAIQSFNEHPEVKKLVHLIRNEKPYFKPEIEPKHLDGTIVFVKPKQDFDRITHQNGLFALFGICGTKKEYPKIEFMEKPCNITHYIIPNKYKKHILEELSRININEATVYCDMDHIVKHYINTCEKLE